MDRDFVQKVAGPSGDSVVFSIGGNTSFESRPEGRFVRYVTPAGQVVEHRLASIAELADGDSPFDSADDDWQDKYLPLLTAIESAINRVRKGQQGLRDRVVITVLDRLAVKPDIRLGDELSAAIQDQLRLILLTSTYSIKEVIGCLKKVLRSAKRHHSVSGPTGYLDFIKDKI